MFSSFLRVPDTVKHWEGMGRICANHRNNPCQLFHILLVKGESIKSFCFSVHHLWVLDFSDLCDLKGQLRIYDRVLG